MTERVTVTLNAELVKGIDRLQKNRSRFIAEAVERELARRRSTRQVLAPPKPSAFFNTCSWGSARAPSDTQSSAISGSGV